MIQTWKIPHMVKGTLTWVPVFNAWRLHRGSTGGTDSARYCYSAWLRHLVTLAPYGFRINGARVGELGPGDSIGIGLAALLSGAAQYTALDIVPFSAKANLQTIFDELLNMYLRQEAIPDNNEFPCLEPRLDSHDFPRDVLELSNLSARSQEIRNELTAGLSGGQPLLSYKAPWTSVSDIDPASLELIFSQAVLEHVDDLDETYQAMFAWLKPGGYASHVIDFSAHHLSPFWNGHWAYSDREWQLVRGQREFLLNRKPLSAHLACAEKGGFEILSIDRLRDNGGLNTKGLSERFQALNCDDARTRGAVLVSTCVLLIMQRLLAVTNMYPTASDPTSGTFVEQQIKGLKQVGLDIEVLLLNRAQKGMSVYLSTCRKVHAAITNFQPDIVHAMYGGVLADRVTAAVDGRPTVVSFCGDDLLGELLSGPVRKFISKCGILSSYRAARRADGVVVKSRNLQDALPHDIPISKIRIIPNGIDLERFKPLDRTTCRNRLGWRHDRLNVLFPTNTGDPRKRPELARASVEVAERLGLRIEMHQLEGVPHDQVPVWLNASDVVLLTSLHEGSPNIIKEALACNVPVVSVDIGDVRERIDGIDGCYLASENAGDLASKLQLIHAGPRRVDSRKKVQALSLYRVAVCLKQFYEQILQSWKVNQTF